MGRFRKGNHAIPAALRGTSKEDKSGRQLPLEMKDAWLEIQAEVVMKGAIEGWVGVVSTHLE